MDFKELSFSPDIRVCIYHVGDENLAYHRHTHISDITYCAAGRLMLELPALGASYVFHPGQFFQVPQDMVHRVSHCAGQTGQSSYVLVQIGQFSIDFVRDQPVPDGKAPTDLGAVSLDYCIGDARAHLVAITRQLTAERPANLSDFEYASIVTVLRAVCENGIDRRADKAAILAQLEDASADAGRTGLLGAA